MPAHTSQQPPPDAAATVVCLFEDYNRRRVEMATRETDVYVRDRPLKDARRSPRHAAAHRSPPPP